jgi:HNH endonuclease
MQPALERLVWLRAGSRCEYCQLAQSFSPLPHAIDHIVSRQHRGATMAENLALACFSATAIRVQMSRESTRSRVERCGYSIHEGIAGNGFAWEGALLVGRTHAGRVTIALLEINRAEAVEFREHLIREGSFPP